MESYAEEVMFKTIDDSNVKVSGSAEDFQKFIYKLFEKNGILNDLRAYLRGHIVTVLRSVETGEPPESRKHFTQRLELTFQAINVIIAEYLMKLEFSYSFSVFISEIPLANMVFDSTKLLFNNSVTDNIMHFSENDIWRILNYLGIKCDTEHALKIIEDYQSGNPLLMCILKQTSLYNEPACMDEAISSEDSSSSVKTRTHEKSPRESSHRCKHYAYCKSCRGRIFRTKEKYKRKKRRLAQNVMKSNILHVDNFARKVTVVEERLVEEMFEQLKNVYEGEMELLREEEQKKVKRSLASHTLLLQKHRDELAEEMRRRRSLMEEELQEKKEFVKGLASALKDAHQQMLRHQRRLQGDADRLLMKENSLKTQLREAEESLISKGEEMRKQISDELIVLDKHVQNMKQERDAIDRERTELENLKRLSDNNIKLLNTFNVQERENLIKQHESMKNELAILKKYIEGMKETKYCIERGTVIEGKERNNNHVNDNPDEPVKQNQVVNDLKKLKNVNFNHTNIEMYRKWNRETGVSCDDSCDQLRSLREENDRLKEFAKQQGSHIELLSLGLRHINRPARPAPAVLDATFTQRMSSRGNFEDRSEQTREDQHSTPIARTGAPVAGDETAISLPRDQPNSQKTKQNFKQNIVVEKDITKTIGHSKSLLRETKEKLRKKYRESLSAREKSPNRILREAKLRLRKLEIEAEAVERSYIDFRKRRADEKKLFFKEKNLTGSSVHLDTKEKVTLKKLSDETKQNISYAKIDAQNNLDFDKYLRGYQKMDISKMYRNRNTSIEKVKPVQHSYYEVDTEKSHGLNYLETPLLEFRKLYQSGKYRQINVNNMQERSFTPVKIESNDSRNNELEKSKTDVKELKILQNNIDKADNFDLHETLDSNYNNSLNNIINVKLNNTVKISGRNTIKESESNTLIESRNNTVKEFENNTVEKCENNTVKESENNTIIESENNTIKEFENTIKESENDKVKEYENNTVKKSEDDNYVEIGKDTPEVCKQNAEVVATSEDEDFKKDKVIVAVVCSPRSDITNIHKIEVEDHELVSKTSEARENPVIVVPSSASDSNVGKSKTEIDIENVSSQVIIVTPSETSLIHDTKESSASTENANLSNDEKYDSHSKDKSVNVNMYTVNELDKNTEAYAEDFSADADNSLSEYSNNSPISILKTSEEENFWDS